MNKTDNKLTDKSSVNGQIELLRFLFCMAVLFFHAEKYFLGEPSSLGGFKPYFFVHGAVGVEFFFVCSGFFMARSIKRDIARNCAVDIGDSTVKFMLHKIKSIAPVHITFYVLAFISLIIVRSMGMKDIVKNAVDGIPSFFLIQMLGFKGFSPNHVSWYLSVMLIAMLVIYPFARKYYSVFVKVAAPVITLFILGYLFLTYGSLSGVMVRTGIFYKSMLRGFAEILTGLTTYEIAEYFSKKEFKKSERILITLLNLAILAGCGTYVMFTLSAKYEFLVIPAASILMITSYSGAGILSGYMNNRFCVLLGKLTMPVYLSQVTFINLIGHFGTELSFPVQTLILAACVFAVSGIYLGISSRFHL